MRIIEIIYHDRLERVHTISVHYIRNLSVHKNINDSRTSFISILYGADYSSEIKLPNEKAYKLYDKLTSWLSNGATNLEVELFYGLSGDAIDYIADEK